MLVYAVPPTKDWKVEMLPKDLLELGEIIFCDSEKQLLQYVLAELEDTDILSGWNTEGFDDPYLYERIKLVLGEKYANKLSFDGARKPYYKEIMDKNGTAKNALVISGRVSIDLMLALLKFEPGGRDSYSLEAISEEIVPELKKLEYEGSLADLYRNDFAFFVRYNLRDCEVLKAIEEKKGLIRLSIIQSHMDTCNIPDVLGTVKITEMAIINYCHHHLNKRVPDSNRDISFSNEKFKGADVLTVIPGLHENVASIDVTSLYPSTMRTLNISPDTLLGQFSDNGDAFFQIRNDSGKQLSYYDNNGDLETHSTSEWKEIFKQNNWVLSAHGTVFDQNKKCVIPQLLARWFNQRVEFKKKAAIAEDHAKKLGKEHPEYGKYMDEYRYYDLFQTAFKLKLNSTYGACGNQYFKFYDIRLAESTTKTGVEVLYHMARTIGQCLHGDYFYPNPSVIAGDTDSNYFKTYAKTPEEALEIAVAITNTINKSFNKFCKDSFFCDEDHSNLYSVAQEVIATKSIFINGKKNYMMHMVYKDGKPCDKIKITGLAIKKTTLPKNIRTIMAEQFGAFLRGKTTWTEVGLNLLELKEKMKNEDDPINLGLPKKIRGLEEVVQKYNVQTEGLRVSGHAYASMMYNKCLEQYADKGSFKIVSGMKIKTYYLTKKFGPFKSIAIPVDLDTIPDWFREHFAPLIDKDAQILRLIDKPLKSILAAIGEKLPTRQTLLMDDILIY